MVAIYGSSTTLQNPIATAASIAFPPALSIVRPASADWGCIDVTAPFWATTSSLLGFQLLLKAILLSLYAGLVMYNLLYSMKADSDILIHILSENFAPWQ
jgi:hypothetical protein